MASVLDHVESTIAETPVSERMTRFKGQTITSTLVTGYLGLDEEESKEWIAYRRKNPEMHYDPENDMRFGDGQAVLLVWYREAGHAFRLQFVKQSAKVPLNWEDIEVYQGQDDSKGGEWKERLLACMRHVEEKRPPARHVAPAQSAPSLNGRTPATATRTSTANRRTGFGRIPK